MHAEEAVENCNRKRLTYRTKSQVAVEQMESDLYYCRPLYKREDKLAPQQTTAVNFAQLISER